MSRKKKESPEMVREKKRAASAVGISPIHFMGESKVSAHWLKVPWVNREYSTNKNQEDLA